MSNNILSEQIRLIEENLAYYSRRLGEGAPCKEDVVSLCRTIAELELQRDGGMDVEVETKVQERSTKIIIEAQKNYIILLKSKMEDLQTRLQDAEEKLNEMTSKVNHV